MSERCWYCGRGLAELLCDYRLGTVLVPPDDAPKQLALGEPPPALVEVLETCDVGACPACAERYGWRAISRTIVCVRASRRGRGCNQHSVDHCHMHAAAENRGSDAWIGEAGVQLLRADARAACVRLAGGTGR